jgi:hypothetical protein
MGVVRMSGSGFAWVIKVLRPWADQDERNRQRLREAIASLRVEMSARAREPHPGWVTAADAHASRAEHLLGTGEFEGGWSALKAASREVIDSYGETELLVESRRLQAEAEDKLHGWRAKAVNDALAPTWRRVGDAERLRAGISKTIEESEDDDPLTMVRHGVLSALGAVGKPGEALDLTDVRQRLKAARAVMDDYLDNVYRRLAILGRNLGRAGWMLFAVLVLATVTIVLALEIGDGSESVAAIWIDVRFLAVVLALGAVGGATSGLISQLRRSAESRIPDELAKRYLIWLRPLTGAAAALGVVTILRAGLGGARIDSLVAFAAAFAAGFSERLVSQAVESASSAITS